MAGERNAVFLGGTGFIGSRVVAALAQKTPYWNITVVSRQKTRPPHLPSQVTWVQGDVVHDGRGQWLMAVGQCNHVFYGVQFPGHPVENPRKGLTYEAYDFGGLQNLIQGLERMGANPRILYLSGAGAGKGLPQPWYRAKDGAEALLNAYSKRVGAPCLSLRPSVVYGAGDNSLNRLLAMAKLFKVVPYLGDGRVGLDPIWVEDLARAFVQFGFDSALEGAYDFPGPVKATLRQLMEALCAARGVKAWPLASPLSLAKAVGSVVQYAPGQLLSPGAVDFLTSSVAMEPNPLFDSFLLTCKSPQQAFALYPSK